MCDHMWQVMLRSFRVGSPWKAILWNLLGLDFVDKMSQLLGDQWMAKQLQFETVDNLHQDVIGCSL